MRIALGIAVTFSIAVGAASYAYLDSKTASAKTAELPRHEVRSTSAPRIAGLAVGTASFEAVTAAARRAGFECEDASLAATMRKAHAKAGVGDKKKPSAEAMKAHLAMLSDPLFFQVRYSCDGVVANPKRGLIAPVGTTGRLLFVHPNATQPLELVSFQRHHTSEATAGADLATTVRALELAYGPPVKSKGEATLGLLAPIEREWHIGKTTVRVRAVWFGARGGSVSQEIVLAPEAS